MVMDTTESYSFILIWIVLTFIHGQWYMIFFICFLASFSVDFNEILDASVAFWFVETHTKFIVYH